MLSRLLFVSAVATLFVSGASARLDPTMMQMPLEDFEAQGLEQLTGRYGTAFPGYAGVNQLGVNTNVIPAQQQFGLGDISTQQFGNLGVTPQNVNWQQTLQQQNIPVQNWQQQQFSDIGTTQQFGNIGVDQQQLSNIGQQYGTVGTFGTIGGQQQFSGIDQQNFAGIDQAQMLQNINPIIMQNEQRNLGLMGSSGVNVQNVRQQRGMQLGLSGVDMVNLQQPVTLGMIPQYQQQQPQLSLASTSSVMPNYQAPVVTGQQLGGSFGGIGMLGAGAPAGGTSKKTTVAQPIYAQNMVVPKIITQPIYRPHAVTQPIIQQQLIQQPIVETRQVIQPVIRRIITQPIIRPEIYESTTIQPTLKTETIVQPRIIQQTVVTPQLQNEYSEQQPIQEKAKTNVAPTQVQATVSGKKQTGGLGLNY